MTALLVEDKAIVVPGEELAEGMDYLPGSDVIRDGDKLISTKVGMVSIQNHLIKIIPLAGKYMPKRNDIVLGKVVGMGFSGWRVDIDWAFEANLALRDASSDFIEKTADLAQYYDYEDWIVCQITSVSASGKLIDLSMKGPGLRKLGPGRMIHVTPSKVPRIIGKLGSMISMIKEATGTKISVGQNGLVWVSGEDASKELLAVHAIQKIEAESHISGLTDRIKAFLEGAAQ